MSEECKGDLCQADRSVKSEQTCDCHLHEHQVCDVCQGVVRQADPTAVGSDGIAPEGALQSGPERKPLSEIISLKMREIKEITGTDPWVTRSPGEAANYIAGYAAGLEEAAKVAETNFHSMKMLGSAYVDGACDAGGRIAHSIRSLIATPTQSQIEEPQRGDTGTAEQREAGLTQNFKSKAQEIADRSMNQPVELVTAISSALSTAYEEGKAAEREACAKIIDDERDRILALEYKTEDQFGHSVNTNLRMAAVKFPDLAAAIRSRKDTDDA
jgi:hypothetical protein